MINRTSLIGGIPWAVAAFILSVGLTPLEVSAAPRMVLADHFTYQT